MVRKNPYFSTPFSCTWWLVGRQIVCLYIRHNIDSENAWPLLGWRIIPPMLLVWRSARALSKIQTTSHDIWTTILFCSKTGIFVQTSFFVNFHFFFGIFYFFNYVYKFCFCHPTGKFPEARIKNDVLFCLKKLFYYFLGI